MKCQTPPLVAFAATVFAAISLLGICQTSLASAQSAVFRNPAGLSKPNGYTHVVVINASKLILISGQTGADEHGKVPTNFAEQAKRAFLNLQTALTAAGAKTSDLVKLNYYVVGLNPERLQALREARDSFINREHPPTSTLVGVQALFREDVQLEIEAEAVLQ